MRQMELHDMVYGWGVMVIYYAIHKEKNHKTQAVCFLISMLFFTLGFKRIAVPAALGAAVMYHCLCWWKPKSSGRWQILWRWRQADVFSSTSG